MAGPPPPRHTVAGLRASAPGPHLPSLGRQHLDPHLQLAGSAAEMRGDRALPGTLGPLVQPGLHAGACKPLGQGRRRPVAFSAPSAGLRPGFLRSAGHGRPRISPRRPRIHGVPAASSLGGGSKDVGSGAGYALQSPHSGGHKTSRRGIYDGSDPFFGVQSSGCRQLRCGEPSRLKSAGGFAGCSAARDDRTNPGKIGCTMPRGRSSGSAKDFASHRSGPEPCGQSSHGRATWLARIPPSGPSWRPPGGARSGGGQRRPWRGSWGPPGQGIGSGAAPRSRWREDSESCIVLWANERWRELAMDRQAWKAAFDGFRHWATRRWKA